MSDVSILQIGIYKSLIRLKEPFIISLGKLEVAENIIVVIEDSTGRKGFGEGSPFRTIHGETVDTCFLVGVELSKLLIGKNPSNINECLALLDRYIYGNTTIKSAFNIALYDLASQNAAMPLSEFLGAKNNYKLHTDYTISLGSPTQMSSDARRIVDGGFPVIKVKLGESKEQDVKRIIAIREEVGMEIPIRVDANQGWNVSNAFEILEELKHLNIQHCEEPFSRKDYLHLPNLRKNSAIPIMADESCFDHHDAEKLLSIEACDAFNIKLGKSSGITNALKIIRIAESGNKIIQIGGFLESRLGFTAAAHLAQCCNSIPHIDFDTPLMFSEDFVLDGIKYGENGKIVLPEKIGLGAYYPEEYLRSLESFVI